MAGSHWRATVLGALRRHVRRSGVGWPRHSPLLQALVRCQHRRGPRSRAGTRRHRRGFRCPCSRDLRWPSRTQVLGSRADHGSCRRRCPDGAWQACSTCTTNRLQDVTLLHGVSACAGDRGCSTWSSNRAPVIPRSSGRTGSSGFPCPWRAKKDPGQVATDGNVGGSDSRGGVRTVEPRSRDTTERLRLCWTETRYRVRS